MTQPQSFVGRYIEDIELALISSAVSGNHLLLIGSPGWGKTAIARSLAGQIANGSEWTFTRFATSTPPEAVTGPVDIAAALGDPPDVVYKTEDTPYDPRARLSIFDEIFRPSDVIFDLFLDLLDRQDVGVDVAPTVWSTSNFVVKSERTEALRDRIAMWVWVVPDELDSRAIVDVHLNRGYNQRLQLVNGRTVPSISDIDDIRKSKPGPNALAAVKAYLEILSDEAQKERFNINPRRLEQWANIVYRTSVYLLDGDNDFTDVPADVGKVMKYAYPCFDKDKWNDWQEVASAVSDPIGSAIETITKDAYAQFKKVQSSTGDKFMLAEKLGTVLADAERSLRAVVGSEDDPRVKDALNELTDCFAALCRGEDPFA
jgi:MoxR-like ATPase